MHTVMIGMPSVLLNLSRRTPCLSVQIGYSICAAVREGILRNWLQKFPLPSDSIFPDRC